MSKGSSSLSISTAPTIRPPTLIQYPLRAFHQIMQDGFSYQLSEEVIRTIKSIAEQVGAPEYIKTPQFDKRPIKVAYNSGGAYNSGSAYNSGAYNNNNNDAHHNYKRNYKDNNNRTQEITDEDWESIRKFQATIIAKKEGVDAAIDKIRKHLNKITTTTYDNLKTQIIEEIRKITKETDIIHSEEIMTELNKIGESLFNIASGNSFYSELYARLYNDLMTEFNDTTPNFMEIIFKNNFKIFRQLFEKIECGDPNKDYDGFCNINKINEKRRAISLFYINLMKLKVIATQDIIDIIQDLQKYMLSIIDNVDTKNIMDELSEIIFILITQGYTHLKKTAEDELDTLMSFVTRMSQMKPGKTNSLTNKSVFKHMDLIDFVMKL